MTNLEAKYERKCNKVKRQHDLHPREEVQVGAGGHEQEGGGKEGVQPSGHHRAKVVYMVVIIKHSADLTYPFPTAGTQEVCPLL